MPLKSPGFGPAYWQDNSHGSVLPMGLVWDNISAFEIGEVSNFSVNLNIGAENTGIKTREWDYVITIENNTDPSNVYLTNNTGSFSTSGSNTFTVHFNTDTFLSHGAIITQPTDAELHGKFGPIRAGDGDIGKYSTLLRNNTVQPTSYRNIVTERMTPATSTTYPFNFDAVAVQENKYGILFRITRTNSTNPSFNVVDFRVLVITFAPLIDIQ